MDLINWVASLSSAQRDAIRTLAIVIGSAFIPVFGFILTWMVRVIRRVIRQVAEQTQTHDYVNGELVPSSLGEMVRRTMHNTEELRGAEVTELVNDPRTAPATRSSGRRRLPTTEIPSIYKGDPQA